jgi:hypothetical protein
MISREKKSIKVGVNCMLYGCKDIVWIEEKDLPLILLEEFTKFGNLGNHLKVVCKEKLFGREYCLVRWISGNGTTDECWIPSEGFSVNRKAHTMQKVLTEDLLSVDIEAKDLAVDCNTSKEQRLVKKKIAGQFNFIIHYEPLLSGIKGRIAWGIQGSQKTIALNLSSG